MEKMFWLRIRVHVNVRSHNSGLEGWFEFRVSLDYLMM